MHFPGGGKMKMRLLAVTSVCLAGFAGPLLAGPSSQVAWTLETVNKIKAADAAHGQQISAGCAGCHGAEGITANPLWPNLAGQLPTYLYKQLRDYKDGTRRNTMMQGLVAGFSDQDMMDVAAFYAQQSKPPANGDGSDAAKGLVGKGDGARLIPSCDSCHGGKGEGKFVEVPALAGTPPGYFVQTMGAYKTGARANDVYSVMRSIAKKLTDAEIKALGDYYAALGAK